jgi:lysophospholipase L1-like esterase
MTEKVIYSDFYREMNNDTSLLQSDKIHLSTGGHAAVANEIIKTIYGKNKSL